MNDATPRAPLVLDRLQEAAGSQWHVQLHSAAESTNALAAATPERGLVVVADHQTAGRGRLGRAWVTPPGAALTFSAVVDPGVEDEWWPLVPLVAGYAVARAIGRGASLKWPNDVMLGARKVCGILVERVQSRPPLAVIGIGINVDQTAAELPVPAATSLTLMGRVMDRNMLCGDVLQSLGDLLAGFATSPSTFIRQYRDQSDTLHRDVRVDLPGDRAVAGRVDDFDEHGRMLLRTPEGLVTLSAGDVVHVRPSE